MNVLIVEDDTNVGGFVTAALREAGHQPQLANTCAAANRELVGTRFDAVVLDLNLPDGDGLNLLREWRDAGRSVPVLILSARDAVADRVRGLDVGADDYLAKPFSIDELNARLRSLLRRQASAPATILEHRDIRLDRLGRTATARGQLIELTNREFLLLELFLRNPGRVLTRTMIAEQVWESSHELQTNLIDVYVRRLRMKLEVENEPPVIRTIRGTGYQLA